MNVSLQLKHLSSSTNPVLGTGMIFYHKNNRLEFIINHFPDWVSLTRVTLRSVHSVGSAYEGEASMSVLCRKPDQAVWQGTDGQYSSERQVCQMGINLHYDPQLTYVSGIYLEFKPKQLCVFCFLCSSF